MSITVERSVTCRWCEETFRGYGRGENGEKRAYREAFAFLRAHHCLPREKSNPLLSISGSDLNAIIKVIHQFMPDVTITRRKSVK